jgi:hypothetical protein
MYLVFATLKSRQDREIKNLNTCKKNVRLDEKMYGIMFSWAVLMLVHCKKRLAIFLSPAGMSLTKLSLLGINR